MRSLLFLLAVCVTTFSTAPIHAHSRSQSFSSWDVGPDETRMVFTVSAREATRLRPVAGEVNLAQRLASHLNGHIRVSNGSGTCEPTRFPSVLPARAGFIRLEQRYRCGSTGALSVTVDTFFDTVTSHVHYASVESHAGTRNEYLFSEGERSRRISSETEPAAASTNLFGYITLGFEHILQGADHIVFLLVLLLVARTLRELIVAITGFTVGHSLTLGLAAMGWVTPNAGVVEALIGFTIVVAALDVLVARHRTERWMRYVLVGVLLVIALVSHTLGAGFPAITLLGLGVFVFFWFSPGETPRLKLRYWPIITVFFGLIHGSGFASALAELGSPTDGMVDKLIGFNVGVELGQVLIVTMAWALARTAPRWMPVPLRRSAPVFSAVLFGCVGAYWFVERSIGF